MKAKIQKFAKLSFVGLLSLLFCVSLLGLVACKPHVEDGKDSIFYNKLETYTLTGDYALTDVDEKACKGAKNQVKLNYAASIDLAGYTLDLNGRDFTVESDEAGCLVTFKNGTIKGGNLNVAVPNGDVEFENLTVDKEVKIEMEAASQTIRMNHSSISGDCTIKSDTHVQIQTSEVKNVTLAGNGALDIGKGAELTNLLIGENAAGAKVNVAQEGKVKGDLTVSAAADVQIYGEVAKLDVKETVQATEGKALNVSVNEGAEVLKIDLKAPANVEVKGNVNNVTVNNEKANLSVTGNATVAKVEMKASAKVQIEANVADVVVSETAAGASVEVGKTATVKNIVVAANDTEVKVESAESVESVKVVETVTGANLSDTVTADTITKDEAEEFLAHTHVYKVISKVEPTCTEEGETVYACIDCNDSYKTTVQPLGHDYAYQIVKFPTETEDGLGKYTCKRCGHSYTEVLPSSGGTTITIPGIGKILQTVFGEGLKVNLDGTTLVVKDVKKDYLNNVLQSTETKYDVMYFDKLEANFDFGNPKDIKGSFVMSIKIAELAALDGFDFAKVNELTFSELSSAVMTLENDTLYVRVLSENLGSSDVNNITIVNLQNTLEWLVTDSSVPQPVKIAASLVKEFIKLENTEINGEVNFEQLKQKLIAIAEKLQNVTPTAPDMTFANFILENCFDKVTADGMTTYTINFAKTQETINTYALMTVSEFMDAVIGEGSSASVKGALQLIPDMTINGAIDYIANILKPYGVAMDDIYSIVEIAMQIAGQPIDIKQMLTTMGDMKFAAVISMMQGVTEEQAQQMIMNTVAQVITTMDQMTVNDLLTAVIENSQGGGKEPDPETPGADENETTQGKPIQGENTLTEETQPTGGTFIDTVSAMLAQYKEVVYIEISTDGSKVGKVTVKVDQQTFSFTVDMTEGLSLGAIYEQANAVIAQIEASFNQNSTILYVSAMNYYASVDTDKQNGSFALIVGTEVPSQNENGETVTVKSEIVNLLATVVNGQFTLKVGAMGIENFIDLSATNANGSLSVMIPSGEAVMPITLTWIVTANSLVAYVNMGEGAPMFQLNASISEQNATVSVMVGGMNEETFIAQDTLLNLDFTPVLDENGLVGGFNVEYLFDLSLFGGIDLNSGRGVMVPSNGNYSTSDEYLYMIHGVLKVLANTKTQVDESGKEVSFLKNMKVEHVGSGADLYSVEYIEEGAEAYYLLTKTEILQNQQRQIKVPAKHGVILPMALNCNVECGDWYGISINAVGEVVYTDLSGNYLKAVNEAFDMYFYYNIVTKEAKKDNVHDYVYSAKLLDGSLTCEDGIGVTYTCSVCGDSHYYESEEHYYKEETTLISGYPEHSIEKSTCICCGHTNMELRSEDKDGHYMNYVESKECDKETISALGVDVNGFYHGELDERMCATCNLVSYEYTWYTNDKENGCICHRLIKIGSIDHNTEELTWIDSFESSSKGHYYQSTYTDWRKGESGKVTDETAASWLMAINQALNASFTLDNMNSLTCETVKCPACGDIGCKNYYFRYSINGKEYNGNVYFKGNGTFGNGEYVMPFTNCSEYLSEIPYDFSSLSGIGGTVEISRGEFKNNGYSFRFENNDELDIYVYEYDMNINWYHYSECTQQYIYLRKENGVWYQQTSNYNARHDYVSSCKGENCVEDGCVKVCKVCGSQEGELSYRHEDYWIIHNAEDIGGMRFDYGCYSCCNSLSYVYITLHENVTLTQNIYICAERIQLNLNGYTLDLNGYDLVLYAYSDNWESGRIAFIDDGKYDETTGENTLGKIVNGNSNKGMLVLATNKGNIDLGNVNVEVKSFLSDTDTRSTIAQSVLQSEGYTLVLGKQTLPKTEVKA